MVRKQPARAKDLPLFAQPVKSDAARNTTGPAPGMIRPLALIGLPLAVGGLLLSMPRPNGAQNRPTGSQSSSTVPAPAGSTQLTSLPDKPRHDISYYTKDVRPNLFSAPLPSRPRAVPPPVVVKPKPPVLPPAPRVEPIDPFADYSYTGTVTVGNDTQALIENSKTHEGDYVKVGDRFQGAQVMDVTDQMVTLKLGDKSTKLAKSDDIVTTPLDKSAPAPAPPQGMPNMPPGMTMMPGGGMVLPNGRVLTPDQAARRMQFMNQRFQGGGGRRGGGGFGGGFGGGGGFAAPGPFGGG